MSVKALRRIQLGKESPAGTAVAATAVWRGVGTIEDQRTTVFPVEDVGILPGTDRSYVPKLQAALAMDAVEATYEQLLYVLEGGIKLVGTGVADGVGSGKIYDYPFAETSANTPQTFTIQGGDDQEAERMEYSFVPDFTLEGKAGEAWMISANWMGRQVALNAFTGALAIPTVEEILFSKTILAIDAIGGTYGGTPKSNTLLAASVKIKTGFQAVYTGGADLYFTFVKQVAPEILIDITFEHDGSAAAQKVNWRAQTPVKLQLLTKGSALTPGTAYSFKSLVQNYAGKWDKFSKIGEQDGNDIVTGTFRARYNGTASDIGEIIVVNTLAALV